MANRRRGTYSLPDELKTTARLSTKKEMAQYRRSLPRCPTPVINKVRRAFAGYMEKPKAIYFKNPVTLDHDYDSDSEMTYFAQIFSTYAPIGEGSFGKVFRARSRKDNEVYAIKRIKSCVSYTDRYSEIHNYEKLGEHPNIVQYFMSWEENSELYMKLEYCDISLGDLSFICHDFPEDFLWNVLYDVCKALYFLHNQHYIHLDVKPANIMMKNGYFKLADFGIMADLKREPLVVKTVSDGDSKYLALEVLEGIYNPACDMFGLGLSLLELASDLELPSYGILWHQLRKLILPETFYQKYSLGFKVIVERMLHPAYNDRPTAEKILKYTTVKAIEKKDKKQPRVNFYEVVRNSLQNEEDIELFMRYAGNDHHFNADVENNNVNNHNNENNNVVCTPPCPPRHSFVDFPEYPSLYRYAAPKPCRTMAAGKALNFDDAKKSPPVCRPRKLSKSNSNTMDFSNEDSVSLIEIDSDFLDGEEKENCDITMDLAPDYDSPQLRVTRSKLSRTKLNFD